MYKKIGIGIGASILFCIMVWSWYSSVYMKEKHAEEAAQEARVQAVQAEEKHRVPVGRYRISQSESLVRWSLGKVFVPDFIATGLFNVGDGLIEVGEGAATGTFSINIGTLQIGRITEEGKETLLKEMLLSPAFFDAKTYPSADFVITEIVAQADSATSFMYRMKGMLTLKGVTKEVTLPTKVYEKGGKLYAETQTEIDRTAWGITASSSATEGDVKENIVKDAVALTISIVATPE